MILCADDFGFSAGVSTAILELISMKRLSATSVMVKENLLPEHVQELKKYHHQLDIGLHLSFKYESLSTFYIQSFFRQLDTQAFNQEMKFQIDRFHELFGFYPDHLDGHMHVHQFPGLRESVAQWSRWIHSQGTSSYVRVCGDRNIFQGKLRSYVGGKIIALPSAGLKKLLLQSGIPHNDFVWGYYDPKESKFGDHFKQTLNLGPSEKDIFFCHPGYVDRELEIKDNFLWPRKETLDYLKSSEFIEVLQSKGQVILPYQKKGKGIDEVLLPIQMVGSLFK